MPLIFILLLFITCLSLWAMKFYEDYLYSRLIEVNTIKDVKDFKDGWLTLKDISPESDRKIKLLNKARSLLFHIAPWLIILSIITIFF